MFVVSMKTTRGRVWTVTAVVALLIATTLVLSGMQGAVPTAATVADDAATVADDAARRAFLTALGYEVDAAEAQVQEIAVPVEADENFTAYNAIQQTAGYDLSAYRGKRVKCWQYGIENYPGKENVQANLYVYKDKVIGGDITSTADGGFCHGLTPLTTGVTAGSDHGTTG